MRPMVARSYPRSAMTRRRPATIWARRASVFMGRNMGAASTRETVAAVARAIDAEPAIADLWVVDHIAIPPDDAEGSDGRYLDPLGTLAFLAGATTRVGLGTSVLVLPYRPPLPTAKLVAT